MSSITNNAKELEERLNAYSKEEANHNSILLFALPNSLREGSSWMKAMSSLATRGLIRTVAIDEAHEVEQSGRSFRKEFVEERPHLLLPFHKTTPYQHQLRGSGGKGGKVLHLKLNQRVKCRAQILGGLRFNSAVFFCNSERQEEWGHFVRALSLGLSPNNFRVTPL
eukprot:scaffold67454_cov44-Cyclotella_meneghiniana.AAC.2